MKEKTMNEFEFNSFCEDTQEIDSWPEGTDAEFESGSPWADVQEFINSFNPWLEG